MVVGIILRPATARGHAMEWGVVLNDKLTRRPNMEWQWLTQRTSTGGPHQHQVLFSLPGLTKQPMTLAKNRSLKSSLSFAL